MFIDSEDFLSDDSKLVGQMTFSKQFLLYL